MQAINISQARITPKFAELVRAGAGDAKTIFAFVIAEEVIEQIEQADAYRRAVDGGKAKTIPSKLNIAERIIFDAGHGGVYASILKSYGET